MMYLNSVIVTGIITKDIRFNVSKNDLVIAELSLAVNRPKRDTVFIKAVCFDKIAENCKRYLHKGSPVIVSGELDVEECYVKETQKKYTVARILVNDLQFMENTYKRRGLMRSDEVPATNPQQGYQQEYQPRQDYQPQQQEQRSTYKPVPPEFAPDDSDTGMEF